MTAKAIRTRPMSIKVPRDQFTESVRCPHLSRAISVKVIDIDNHKGSGHNKGLIVVEQESYSSPRMIWGLRRSSYSSPNLRQMRKPVIRSLDGNWNCADCGTSQSPWLCLTCGLIYCGRYLNQDALKHYKEAPRHCVSINCNDYKVFCYRCDCFVNTGAAEFVLDGVRSSLMHYNRLRMQSEAELSEKSREDFSLRSPRTMEVIRSSPDLERSRVTLKKEGSVNSTKTASDSDTASIDVKFNLIVFEDDSKQCSESSFVMSEKDSSSSKQLLETNGCSENYLSHSVQSVPNLSKRRHEDIEKDLKKKRKITRGGSESSCTSLLTTIDGVDHSGRSLRTDVDGMRRIRGLKNLGNTCFINSVIQALNCVEIFRLLMSRLPPLKLIDSSADIELKENCRYETRNGPSESNPRKKTFFSEEMRKIFLELNEGSMKNGAGSSGTLIPDGLIEQACKLSPRYKTATGFKQQDAHEFLRLVIDRMVVELSKCDIPDSLLRLFCDLKPGITLSLRPRINNRDESCALSALFEGIMQSRVTCLSCGKTSDKLDPFYDLSLDIKLPEGFASGPVSLSSCLRNFFAKEELESPEQYDCGRCHRKRPSTKQLFIKLLPNVLCLHIKRFRWGPRVGKVENIVEFPLQGLDFSKYLASQIVYRKNPELSEGRVDSDTPRNGSLSQLVTDEFVIKQNAIYDLASIVIHQGHGPTSGHYYTYGRHDGQWLNFNDAIVRRIDEREVMSSSAYILFYVRRK
ncbi:hypothetical protein AB6A40_000603 [Gnathostoma spinigerum]|uniref:Ubiquitin carboxyl-terminal hydrolase n=1 Tax=Gnathostoma spinigerum TaxID=75299 RepID=A0ABD6E944_9BILA